jgi:hypothetical protein
VLYGLRSLLKVEQGRLAWIADPFDFVQKHLEALVGAFRMPMEMAGFDPQKIAKNENSYRFMLGEVEKQLIIERGEH